MKVSHTAPKRMSVVEKLVLSAHFSLATLHTTFESDEAKELAWVAALADYPRSAEIYQILGNMEREARLLAA